MGPFTTLPDDSLSEILSRTSPIDASRFAVISKGFNSAAKADTVWDRFLPHDYSQIISRSVLPMVYATKKELYLSLCHSPILLDGGKLSFSLEKRSGKKCYMVDARELVITWGDTPEYWDWTYCAESRFSEVAVLKSVCWLDIRGKMKTQMLSANTTYGAYLVFKLAERSYGLELANAVVRFVNNEEDVEAENRAITVHLQQANTESGTQRQTGRVPMRMASMRNGARQQAGQLPVRRSDEWMEIELGHFYNDRGNDGDVEARLMQIKRLYWKFGLIIEGIEFRPKT